MGFGLFRGYLPASSFSRPVKFEVFEGAECRNCDANLAPLPCLVPPGSRRIHPQVLPLLLGSAQRGLRVGFMGTQNSLISN